MLSAVPRGPQRWWPVYGGSGANHGKGWPNGAGRIQPRTPCGHEWLSRPRVWFAPSSPPLAPKSERSTAAPLTPEGRDGQRHPLSPITAGSEREPIVGRHARSLYVMSVSRQPIEGVASRRKAKVAWRVRRWQWRRCLTWNRRFSSQGGDVRRRVGLGGAPKVRRACSSVEAISSWVCSRVASPCSQRWVAARLRPVQHSSA